MYRYGSKLRKVCAGSSVGLSAFTRTRITSSHDTLHLCARSVTSCQHSHWRGPPKLSIHPPSYLHITKQNFHTENTINQTSSQGHHQSAGKSIWNLLAGGAAFLGVTLYVLKNNNVHAKSATETGHSPTSTGGGDSGAPAPGAASTPAPDAAADAVSEAVVELPDIPSEIPYLIVGAGTSGFAAYRSIRAADGKAKVLLIGEENHVPYMRPHLSKKLWLNENRKHVKDLKVKAANGKETYSIFYEPDYFYYPPKDLPNKETGAVSIVRGRKVVRLDVTKQIATLDNGREIKYEKCLLATGGRPKNLPVFEKADEEAKKRITTYRNVDDFRRLYKVCRKARSVAIIGGGFLGSELAYGVANKKNINGMKIHQIFPESGNLGLVLPNYLSQWVSEEVRTAGVNVIPNNTVTTCVYNEETRKVELTLTSGEVVSVDHVVVSVGMEPAVELGRAAGLEIDREHGGYMANTELEARRNVWVAGDAASFYDMKLGRRRAEHHEHAIYSGRLAGANMTGARKPYLQQPCFWSDLGDNGLDGVGLTDSTLPTYGYFAKAPPREQKKEESATDSEENKNTSSDCGDKSSDTPAEKEEFERGVVFYTQGKRIVGIVTWNLFGLMPIAKSIVNNGEEYEDFNEVAKLFDIHETMFEDFPEEE